MLMRLDKFLSESGAVSRREGKQMIRDGRVTVDGTVVREPEQKIDSDSHIVADGREVKLCGQVLLMMNKPAGYLTAVEDAEWKREPGENFRRGSQSTAWQEYGAWFGLY